MTMQRALLLLLLLLAPLASWAQTPTTFTYQGRLYNGGALANGSHTLRIRPFNQATNGSPLAAAVTTPALNVVDGIFSTTLDFGSSVFLGGPVWLEIEVQAPATGFVALTPRQPVTPTPYAINADKLDGLDAAQLMRASGLMAFSSGPLNGPNVVSAAPVLLGFGSSTVENIDGSGQSTQPPQVGGFSVAIPFDGTIQDLQISADLLVPSAFMINILGLQYDFTVLHAPSVPNTGIDHPSASYVTTPLTASVRFGFPNTAIMSGTFRTASNLGLGGPLVVAAGDRIAIRVRTDPSTNSAAPDVTQLSFSATLTYSRAP